MQTNVEGVFPLSDHDELIIDTGISENVEPGADALQSSATASAPATAKQLLETETKLEERMSGFERSMIRLTRYGLVVTIVTGIIFAGQLYEMIVGGTATDKLVGYAQTQANAANQMSQSADDFTDSAHWMEEHMEDAANSMQDSVDTTDRNTKLSIANAQNAFHEEQRAWVGVRSINSHDFTETSPWHVTVVFTNSGKTPARNVYTSGGYKTSNVPLAGPLDDDIKKLEFRRIQSIAPEGSYYEEISNNVVGEPYSDAQQQGNKDLISEYQAIKNMQQFLYYLRILKYEDSSGKQRQTHFSIFLANPDTKESAFCDKFNDLN